MVTYPELTRPRDVSPEQQAFEAGIVMAGTIAEMLAGVPGVPVNPDRPQAGQHQELTVVRARNGREDVSQSPNTTVSITTDEHGFTRHTMTRHRDLLPGMPKGMSQQKVSRTLVTDRSGMPVMFEQSGGDWEAGGDLPNRPTKSKPIAIMPCREPERFAEHASSTIASLAELARPHPETGAANVLKSDMDKNKLNWARVKKVGRYIGRIATLRAPRSGNKHY